MPGAFGERGTERIINAITWARTKKGPFLGIGVGMQLVVIKVIRNVCGIKDANSEELRPNAENHTIVYMPEVLRCPSTSSLFLILGLLTEIQIDKTKLGGTMRLGKLACIFQPGTECSRLRALYGDAPQIAERHCHRCEVNLDMIEKLEAAGLTIVRKGPKGDHIHSRSPLVCGRPSPSIISKPRLSAEYNVPRLLCCRRQMLG